MINKKSAREMKLKHIIQGRLTAYSAKLSSSSFSSRNHSSSKGPKTSRISNKKEKILGISPIHLLEKKMAENLLKYNTTIAIYNVKIINDIIYDEKKHIVCLFKNYLLWDEISDFLKRFYYTNESISRLPKITGYYEKYTLFAPIYYQLDCIKLMRKNVKKKKRYLEMVEENEDKVEQNSRDKRILDFKVIIKPEDVNIDETNKTIKSFLNNHCNTFTNQNDNRDISLTINLKDSIDGSNNNLSQLINKVINNTSMSVDNNEIHLDNEEIDPLLNEELYKYELPHDKQTNYHIKTKNINKVEIKKLNLNKIKGINNYQENHCKLSNQNKENILPKKIKEEKKQLSNKLQGNDNNEMKNNPNKNILYNDIKKKSQMPSLTVTHKSKHKNRIIKDKINKFISIDNLFKIIQIHNKQYADQKTPITSRIVSNSKKKEFDNDQSHQDNMMRKPKQSKQKSNLINKKTNLVINHNLIKPLNPSSTVRNNSSRNESKSQPQSQSKIKKKIIAFARNSKKHITPLNNNITSSNNSKKIEQPQGEKNLISFLKSQSINNQTNISNKHKFSQSNRNPSNEFLDEKLTTKKKNSNQTQATATSNTSKIKEKLSYELNNFHLSIHKQTNGLNEPNQKNNQTINININCNLITNQKDTIMQKEIPIKKLTNIDKTISRNDKKIINKLQSSHTNRLKNMVIPINSSDKLSKNKQKNQIKEKKIENKKQHDNNKHETSMRVVKNNKIKVEPQRKYPLTSRNEKESIPIQLINKIMIIKNKANIVN